MLTKLQGVAQVTKFCMWFLSKSIHDIELAPPVLKKYMGGAAVACDNYASVLSRVYDKYLMDVGAIYVPRFEQHSIASM